MCGHVHAVSVCVCEDKPPSWRSAWIFRLKGLIRSQEGLKLTMLSSKHIILPCLLCVLPILEGYIEEGFFFPALQKKPQTSKLIIIIIIIISLGTVQSTFSRGRITTMNKTGSIPASEFRVQWGRPISIKTLCYIHYNSRNPGSCGHMGKDHLTQTGGSAPALGPGWVRVSQKGGDCPGEVREGMLEELEEIMLARVRETNRRWGGTERLSRITLGPEELSRAF